MSIICGKCGEEPLLIIMVFKKSQVPFPGFHHKDISGGSIDVVVTNLNVWLVKEHLLVLSCMLMLSVHWESKPLSFTAPYLV